MAHYSPNWTSFTNKKENLARVFRNPDFSRVVIRYDLPLTSGCFHLPRHKSIWQIRCGSIPRKHYINWALLSQLILHHRDNWLSYTNQCIRLEGYIFSLARISTLSVDILEFLLLAAPFFISLCTRGLLLERIQLFPAIPTWFIPWLFCHGVVLIFPNEEICWSCILIVLQSRQQVQDVFAQRSSNTGMSRFLRHHFVKARYAFYEMGCCLHIRKVYHC